MKELPLVSIVIPTHNRKEKLVRLLCSIFEGNYPRNKLEVIVVDDASTDGTCEVVKRRFPEVKVIRNKRELFLAGSRNVGIKSAKGKYIFLIDDDNVVDKNCILELVETMEKDSSIGIVAPIMYYLSQPHRIWCAGVKRCMFSSLTKIIGRGSVDNGQLDKLLESDDFPNAFMVRREVFREVGLFNEFEFPIHYDEADFGERARRKGYKVVCNTKAKVWHDVHLTGKRKVLSGIFHIHSELRAYYAGRNRVIFHKKYSSRGQFLVFITLFNWIFTAYYLGVILFGSKVSIKERIKIARSYVRGILDGLL